MKTAIVVTTINRPDFLPCYVDELRTHPDATMYLICDRKTPPETVNACSYLRGQGGLRDQLRSPSLQEQEEFLINAGVPDGFIPFDSDNRRNVGTLMALADGCDIVIHIDDDNYCTPGWLAGHLQGVSSSRDSVLLDGGTEGPWFDPVHQLHGCGLCFARGVPYAAREAYRHVVLREAVDQPVVINAGLWTGDPDVDAVTRLALRPVSNGQYAHGGVRLATETWAPINSQNTAMTREAALTYWYVRMEGKGVSGESGSDSVNRFGDILAGYFTLKCAKAVGKTARFGTPVVEHMRTQHDLLSDLQAELPGIRLIEKLMPLLTSVDLGGRHKTMLEAYDSLAYWLHVISGDRKVFTAGEGCFLADTAASMNTWQYVVRRFV